MSLYFFIYYFSIYYVEPSSVSNTLIVSISPIWVINLSLFPACLLEYSSHILLNILFPQKVCVIHMNLTCSSFINAILFQRLICCFFGGKTFSLWLCSGPCSISKEHSKYFWGWCTSSFRCESISILPRRGICENITVFPSPFAIRTKTASSSGNASMYFFW